MSPADRNEAVPPVLVRCAIFLPTAAMAEDTSAMGVPLPPAARMSTVTVSPRSAPLRWVGSFANSLERSCTVTRLADMGSSAWLPAR